MVSLEIPGDVAVLACIPHGDCHCCSWSMGLECAPGPTRPILLLDSPLEVPDFVPPFWWRRGRETPAALLNNRLFWLSLLHPGPPGWPSPWP